MRKRSTRYFATPAGAAEPTVVDLEPLEDGRFRAELDGALHELDARFLSDGELSLMVDGQSLEVSVVESAERVRLGFRGARFELDVTDERRMRLRAVGHRSHAEGRHVVAAPMPGKVVRVLVKEGDPVGAGQGLVVVEAMKMENELKSPKEGTVSKVEVREGQTVEGGACLVVIE